MSETLSTTQDSAPFYQNTLEALGVAPVSPEDFDRLLSDHLARYLPYLGGEDRVPLLFGVVNGLLSDLSRKTDDPARQELAKTLRSTPTANFMSRDDWDDPGALAEHQRAVAETLGGPGAMITCDTVDFPKSSHMPPGVARQHAGPRSKMENCQIAVMIGYVSEKGAELLDYELFMPEAWFGEIYENRR